MGRTVDVFRNRVGEFLRVARAAPALPVFSIQLCWPLPASAGARDSHVAPLVATVQFSLGRRPAVELAGAAPPRRHARRGADAVRQLQARLGAARREADREFARALLAYRQDRAVRPPATGTVGAWQSALLPFVRPARPRLQPAVPSPADPAGLQDWVLLCLSRADGVALRWQQRRLRPRKARLERCPEV